MPDQPNVVYFHVEPCYYGGGVVQGAETKRIDQFAARGTPQLLNFAPDEYGYG